MRLPIDFATLPDWQQAVVIIAAAVGIAILARILIDLWLRQSKRFSTSGMDRMVLADIQYPLVLSVWLSGVYVALPLLVPPRSTFLIGSMILTVIILVWGYAAIRLGSKFVANYHGAKPVAFAPVLKNLWTFFVIIASFFVFLSVWRIDITPWIASVGVLGIILGIAAQDALGNFFAGISLNLDQTYNEGDLIQLEDGTRGTVTRISIRSTTILTRDNIDVTVPNSELNSTQVINESSPERTRRIRLDVGVAYGSDLNQVSETMLAVAARERIILDDPAPVIQFRSFDDSAIRAQLQCFIRNPAQWGKARDRLIRGIWKEFDEKDIKIPFPQRELTFFESGNTLSVTGEQSISREEVHPEEQ